MADLDNPVLLHLASQLRFFAGERGLRLALEPVPYGVRLRLEDPRLPDGVGSPSSAGGILYHSAKKKRVSWVPEGRNDPALAKLLNQRVLELIGEREQKASSSDPAIGIAERGLKSWVGTDETGKGDLFGPLVIGGFVADREIARALLGEGVRDSKELTRPQIERLAALIRDRWPDRCTVVLISPQRYNELYSGFERKGGVNGLLGWAHATAIKQALAGSYPLDGAVVDKFAGEHRIRPYLNGQKIMLTLRPKAESNPAVAAAAILARSRYEHALDAMRKGLGWRPHPGAGAPAVADLHRLAKERPGDLGMYVKLHFKPVQMLRML